MTIQAENTAGAAAPAAGGAAAGAGDVENVAPAPAGDASRLSDDELVAGLEGLESDGGAAAPPKPGEKPPAKKPDDKPAEQKKEGEIEVKLDAAASKSIEATNRYRAQVERQLQTREAALAKRETELAPQLQELASYKKAKAERDPLAVAEALGFGVDELETLSHAIYKLSKSASPADRAAAAQLLKQRQSTSEVDTLKGELEKLKTEMQQREVRAQQEAFVQEYTGQLTGAVVTTEHTLVANALKNAPKEARQELLHLAARMEQQAGGATPTPAEVIKAYEGQLRRQAAALGFDPSKLGQQDTSSTTTPTPESAQKKTTGTLKADLGPQTRSRSAPQSRDEAFDETAREIEEMERAKSRRS